MSVSRRSFLVRQFPASMAAAIAACRCSPSVHAGDSEALQILVRDKMYPVSRVSPDGIWYIAEPRHAPQTEMKIPRTEDYVLVERVYRPVYTRDRTGGVWYQEVNAPPELGAAYLRG
jgi:hypothetical protein